MIAPKRITKREGSSSLERLAQLIRPYWYQAVIANLMMVLLTVVNITVPLLIALVFNRVFPNEDWGLLMGVLLGVLGLYIGRNALYYYSKCATVQIGENVAFNLRKQLFERIQQMNLSYYRRVKPGQLSSQVLNDSSVIQQFIQDDFPKLAQAALLFLGIVATIFAINWQLALASTIVLPLHLLAYLYFRSPIKQAGKHAQQHMAEATGNLIEKFLGIEVVKGFAGESRESAAFQEAISRSRASQLEGKRYHVLQKVVADLLVGIGIIALFGFGAFQVMGVDEPNRLLPGDFIAFFWYVRMLYPAVIDTMAGLAKLTRTTSCVERAHEVLTREGVEGSGKLKPVIRGEVEYRGVSFGYDNSLPVLKDLSFKVPPGHVCAIIGASGSGKSTLVSLLPRFIDACSGSILLDGNDVRSIDLQHLRSVISVSFQECFLFNATILENIRYARPGADLEQIRGIASQIGADGFIESLPEAYDTLLGEGGVQLSRGQKQLITLMRAMLREPQVLILDEATASMDKALESRVVPAILRFMEGRTSFLITHNPDLLEHADRVLHLQQGGTCTVYDGTQRGGMPGKDLRISQWLRTLAVWAVFLGAALWGTSAASPLRAEDASAVAKDKAAAPLPAITHASQLESRKIRLSYTDPERCLKVLQVFGYHVGQAGTTADVNKLPWVISVPGSADHKTVQDVGADFPLTAVDPLNELMVFFDPSKPQQFSEVLHKVRSEIDLPSRQIMVEAMVLEISEDSLKSLGVDWSTTASLSPGSADLRIGKVVSSSMDTVTLDITDLFKQLDVKLRALVREGQAEILSRPSVMTLDNRMAYINVAERIPVASTKFQGNNNINTVDFKDKLVGIQLSVRPRVAEDGKEISMQISASVSARVPNQDVVVTDFSGNVVATSPTISERVVRTYARIANNTPFIIGGLVSRDELSTTEKVPVLGSLPVIGKAFQNKSVNREKREVIIVITPFVLPEDDVVGRYVPDDNIVGRNLPKDEDAFDSFGNQLFRDAYRIREQDVFDLNFLVENEELKSMQAAADEAVRKDFRLSNQYPFSVFVNGRIPGEHILVFRQMYEVIKRIGLERRLDEGRFIFFREDVESASGFSVTFFKHYLDNLAEKTWEADRGATRVQGTRPDDPWEAIGSRALALTYTLRRDSTQEILDEPVPQIQVLDCPDGDTYDRLLWDLNQPDEEGRPRYSILLRSDKDLVRLKRALILRQTVLLNSNARTLTLDNFSVGRLLLLPARTQEKIDLIDADAAMYFFYTEQYYQALKAELDRDMAALKQALE